VAQDLAAQGEQGELGLAPPLPRAGARVEAFEGVVDGQVLDGAVADQPVDLAQLRAEAVVVAIAQNGR